MLQISFDNFLAYTDWQRAHWQKVLQHHGPSVLSTTAGPNRDGRFEAVGDVIRRIFSAETLWGIQA